MSKFSFHRAAALTLLAAVLMLGGCSKPTEGTSVAGRVTYQEEPLADGSLMFYPSDGRPTAVALGADGTYSCQLPAGEYRVTVNVGVKLPAGWDEGDPVPRPSIQLPTHYTSRARTPIQVTISENQTEPLDLTLN